MKVVATICSRKKDPDTELLLAKDRYQGDHVRAARAIAEKEDLPLYILSGKFGLISGDDVIPDYDYYLDSSTDALINLVAAQMGEAGITEIDFYAEDKDTWLPYATTIVDAAGRAGVALTRHWL